MRKFPLSELLSVITFPALFLLICWIVFLSDTYLQLNLYQFGVNPRTLSGLKGIAFAPFIHGDFGHIINNSLPIFILSSMIFYFYKSISSSGHSYKMGCGPSFLKLKATKTPDNAPNK